MTVYEEVEEAVFRNVAKCFDIDIKSLSLTTQLTEDLGALSINFVQVIAALEEELGIEIRFMEFRRRNSIENIIKFLVETIN